MQQAITDFLHDLKAISNGKYFLILMLFTVAVFMLGLEVRHFWGADEPRVAGIAAETVLYGNWVEPRLNGKAFLEMPPLYYWSDALSIMLFGRGEFAAKLPSAVAACCGVAAVFFLVLKMGYSGFAAMLSGIMLATCAQYWRIGRKCMVDMMLCAFIAIAMLAFYSLIRTSRNNQRILWYIIFAAGLGGGIMTKGLIGLAVPASALFCWLLISDIINKKICFPSWFYLFSGAALSFIPVGIWLWLLYRESGYNAFYTVTWTNNIGRFTGVHQEHIEPFYYYLLKLPEQLQPWAVLLPFALIYHIRRVFREKAAAVNSLYLLCWLIVPYLMLILAAGKRQVYLLPLYPAEIMLIGTFAAMFLEDKLKSPGWLNPVAVTKYFVIFAAVSVTITPVVLACLCLKYKTGAASAAAVMSVGLLIAMTAWLFLRKRNLKKFFASVLTAVAAMLIFFDMVAYPAMTRHYSFQPLFAYCRAIRARNGTLYLYEPTERISGGTVFYLGEKAEEIDAAALERLKKSARRNLYVLAPETVLKNIAGIKIIELFRIKGEDTAIAEIINRTDGN